MDAFDPVRFAALAGSCYRKLGQLEAAEELLQLALTQLDLSSARRHGRGISSGPAGWPSRPCRPWLGSARWPRSTR